MLEAHPEELPRCASLVQPHSSLLGECVAGCGSKCLASLALFLSQRDISNFPALRVGFPGSGHLGP